MTASLFGDCDPSYAAWQAVNNTHMMVDLMSLTSIGDDRPPLWLFLSVSFGWIAHADLGTEKMRWAGNVRFSAGAAYQVVLKKKYKCSVATHGAQAPPADLNVDAITQRTAIKNQLRDFYNERYNRRQVDYIHTELPKDGNIGDIIDSNLPMDKWQHANYEQMNCFYAGKAPWVSKEACAFPTALANDGYIDVCMLSGAGWGEGFEILRGFDQGLHFNHPTISYQKVKAFKLIPGIRYQGDDTENLNKDATPAQTVHKVPRRPDREVNGTSFRDKYYLSVDGERYDARHGVVCEVHQGLARFTCDSKLEKYQPTTLHQGRASQTAATVRHVLDEANPNSEGNLTFDQWLSMWESRLGGWKLQHMASSTM
jgi:diacylglycerol kinase family enzyme